MKFAIPLIILLVLHAVFVMLEAYSIRHLDSAMHFFGGITLAIFVTGLTGLAVGRGWCPDPGRLLLSLLVVSMVTTGAVCWEIFEWLSDAFLGTHFQLTLDDTIKDLALGLAGGAVWVTRLSGAGASATLPGIRRAERKPS
jgi:hypothetical protein